MENTRFNADDLTQVTEWVELTQALVASGPELNRELLKGAVWEIAGRCNARWPLEPGGQLAIGADELEADFDLIGEDVAIVWIGKTALCLFAGLDGPNLTANVLCAGIDKLADVEEAT